MEKSPDAFRTISEAAEELNLPQHVLRFWETRFSSIKPLKRGGGRRYYRPEDVLLLKGIRHLLYDQGFTIKGVQRILRQNGGRQVAALGGGGTFEPAVFDAPVQGPAEPAVAIPSPTPALHLHHAPVPDVHTVHELEPVDRDRLSRVMRDLLDCKRMLERAREN